MRQLVPRSDHTLFHSAGRPRMVIGHILSFWPPLHGRWPSLVVGHPWSLAILGRWPSLVVGHPWSLAILGRCPSLVFGYPWSLVILGLWSSLAILGLWPSLDLDCLPDLCLNFPCKSMVVFLYNPGTSLMPISCTQ